MEVHVSDRSLGAAFLALAVIAAVVAFGPWATRLPRRESASRSAAASHLRQIGQANLIYASDHRDMLPVVENVWDYAGELARDGGLNDATIWVVAGDPANKSAAGRLSTVLGTSRRELDPAFRKLVPSWAVPLGRLNANMPATMPIAWTRGLRQDGTWASHSPNGTKGGHVVFLGGNVAFYRNVRDALRRYDGNGMTSNILEALPPGTQIGEYAPNAQERSAWAWTGRMMKFQEATGPLMLPGLWLLALMTLIVQVMRERWPGWLLVWFLVLSFIVAIMAPTVG